MAALRTLADCWRATPTLREVRVELPMCIGPLATLLGGPACPLAPGAWLLGQVQTPAQEVLFGLGFPSLEYLREAAGQANWPTQLAHYALEGGRPLGPGTAYGCVEQELLPLYLAELRQEAERSGVFDPAWVHGRPSDEQLLLLADDPDLCLYFTRERPFFLKTFNSGEHLAFILYSACDPSSSACS